ncbi:MAG: hypothetical protein ACLFUV_02370 [Methanomassiliicoccales archaeon]
MSMGLLREAARFASGEIDSFLVLEKRMHRTLVYGITHARSNGRRALKKTSELLQRMGEE